MNIFFSAQDTTPYIIVEFLIYSLVVPQAISQIL